MPSVNIHVAAARQALEEAKLDIEMALKLLSDEDEVFGTEAFRVEKAIKRCSTIMHSADEARANLSYKKGVSNAG